METKWIVYDARYRTNEDSAVCFEVCESEKEARDNYLEYGTDTVIVKAIIKDGQIIESTIMN